MIFARNVLGHDNMPPLFMYLFFFCYRYKHGRRCFFFTFPILRARGFIRRIQLLLLLFLFFFFRTYDEICSYLSPEFMSPRPWLAREDGKNNVFLRSSNYYSRGETNKKKNK